MRGKSALVTGGAGFIGSFLVGRLLNDGWQVKVLDNLTAGRIENLNGCEGKPDFKLIIGDLKDRKLILEAVRDTEVIFHLAANPEVRVSTTNPRLHFNENVVSTFNLLEAIRIAGDGKYLVFASSSSVYGEPTQNPVTEDVPPRPVSVYGASKASCEAFIMTYSHLYGVNSVATRYANIVGPRLRHGVIYDLLMKLKRDADKLEILGDGSQMRSFLWVEDAVDATLKILGNLSKGFNVYNVGNMDWISVKDVADEVTSVMSLKEVRYVYKPDLNGVGWPGDVKRLMLDINKIKSLEWKPTMNSRQSVRRTTKALLEELEK